MKTRIYKVIGNFITGILILNGAFGFGLLPRDIKAQKRAVIVNAEQPNVWTLEQAHYLLAQMHRRNLDLKAKSLEDLDANEINGLRFEVLRMLTEFGVKFDQADLVTNNLLLQNRTFNNDQRQLLITRRNRLSDESLELSRQIAQLESEKAGTDDEDEKSKLDGKITAAKAHQAKVDKEIEQINAQLDGLPGQTGDLKSTQAEANFDPNKLPKSDAFDQAFKDAVTKQIQAFNEAPKLNAALRLDNFLQLQYEIISKQLTLLRDEVGPGERLLFLELPQTVNSTYDKADKKWAQSWWKIAGYTSKVPYKPTDKESYAKYQNKAITSTAEKIDRVIEAIKEKRQNPNRNKNDYKAGDLRYVDLDKESTDLPNGTKVENRSVRTVELIPRQSSLNVNDMKLKVKSGALSVVASFLFGFGAKLNVQRQREQFSQFVQQELYSAAFGKGAREFGWTFTPMPGTDRLMSGVRTTYAIVVIPKEANAVVLESNGCFFPRSEYQPYNFAETLSGSRWQDDRTSRSCGDSKAFIVSVPNVDEGENDFEVRSISYQPVDKGKRIVVSIGGDNFSSQMGVLINGVPLIPAIGLAQPLIRDDSKVFEATSKDFEKETIHGQIERVDSNRIVLSFKMPDDFEDTPTITLIAPGRAVDINWFDDIAINGKFPATLLPIHDKDCKKVPQPANCVTIAARMFNGEQIPERPPFRIDGIEAFRGDNGKVSVVVTGAGFDSASTKTFVNGIDKTASNPVQSKSLIVINDLDAMTSEKIQVTLANADKTIKSALIPNPAYLKVDKVTVVSYEGANGKKQAVLVVRLDGTGFPSGLISPNKKVIVTVTSSTEAYLRIQDPDAAEVVTLKDPVTKVTINTVVTRKPPK